MVLDSILLSTLARICAAEGDINGAKMFSSVCPEPDFPRCRRCECPLLMGETATLKVRRKFISTLSCKACFEPRASTLRKPENRKKAISVKRKPSIPPPPTTPEVLPTPAKKKPRLTQAPSTLLARAEQEAKLQKKLARKSLSTTTTSTAPPFASIAKLLSSG